MYENLVARLRAHNGWALNETLAEAADAIEELTDIYVGKWIPVTERLPRAERESYWVCTDTGYQCEARWTNNVYGLCKSDNKNEWGWSIADIPQYQKVVAWRVLPQPYTPPKEET